MTSPTPKDTPPAGPAVDPVSGPAVPRTRDAPPTAGKIWRYAVISFCVIVAAAILYWLATGLAAHPPTSRTTQDALHGATGAPASGTVN